MEYFLGIDVGGTNIKFGVVSSKVQLINKEKFPTEYIKESKNPTKTLLDKVDQQLQKYPHIRKVGIGLPGMCSKDRKQIYYLQNIPQLNGVPLIKKLKKRFPSKTFYLENDANAATLGEYICSKQTIPSSFLLITMGTGIGGGLLIDGKIFKGGNGNGVEIGHIISGNGKTIEQNVGKKAITAMILNQIQKTSNTSSLARYRNFSLKKLFNSYSFYKAVEEKDKVALFVCDKLGIFLGELIVSCIRMFDVNTLLIGGGMGKIFVYLEESMYKKIKKFLPEYYLKNLLIKQATLGNNAGIIGAASLCFDSNQHIHL